jgi:ubiquinone/menaquinone biosynthesis C-methylase UbiE
MIDSRRPATPQDVFTRFASRYDRMNSIASLGKVRKWRAQVARQPPVSNLS